MTDDPKGMTVSSQTKTPKQTLLEEGTVFKGTLKSSCPIVVNGMIEGEVTAPEITIARTGTVLGTIKARTLRSYGLLAGNVDAGDVFLFGAVRSNTVIKARTLEVKLGSPNKGHLEVIFGEHSLDAEARDATAQPNGATPVAATFEGAALPNGAALPDSDSALSETASPDAAAAVPEAAALPDAIQLAPIPGLDPANSSELATSNGLP
jgi:cytoskeletal protein CcmA (bactofilin family)